MIKGICKKCKSSVEFEKSWKELNHLEIQYTCSECGFVKQKEVKVKYSTKLDNLKLKNQTRMGNY